MYETTAKCLSDPLVLDVIPGSMKVSKGLAFRLELVRQALEYLEPR